jgi:hypothetical protein
MRLSAFNANPKPKKEKTSADLNAFYTTTNLHVLLNTCCVWVKPQRL